MCEAAAHTVRNKRISEEMVAVSASDVLGSGRKQEVSALPGNANEQ